MPKEFGRNKRVSDLVQRQLASLIQKDNDLKSQGLVTVSSVDVSPDLLNATIYVTNLDDEADRTSLIELLNDKAGYYRHELAKGSPLRKMPRLNFVFDSSVEYGARLSSLIDSLEPNSDD